VLLLSTVPSLACMTYTQDLHTPALSGANLATTPQLHASLCRVSTHAVFKRSKFSRFCVSQANTLPRLSLPFVPALQRPRPAVRRTAALTTDGQTSIKSSTSSYGLTRAHSPHLSFNSTPRSSRSPTTMSRMSKMSMSVAVCALLCGFAAAQSGSGSGEIGSGYETSLQSSHPFAS
jgi:hypothetical protein